MDSEHSVHLPELYFAIQKFLSTSPLSETYRVFCKELEENDILPERLDWKGHKHKRPPCELERLYPGVGPNHLLQICSKIGLERTKEFATTAKGLKPFLGIGSLVFGKKDKNLSNNVYFYTVRKHGKSYVDPFSSTTHNIIRVLQSNQISGPITRSLVFPARYSSLQLQRQTLGHLSAVYCLMFDHSGRYIFTGADDLLIKLWSSTTGRLLATFRGASSEITDIDINLENTLLAAGSIDRILRVWSIQTGAPVAVLPGHTGMITSVNFSPLTLLERRYLITTSTDGSVAFWSYQHTTGNTATFACNPTIYHERIRPGQAKMICSSFSPGGNFLATGCADHHVRIYHLLDEGPKRILEEAAHADPVDSIQWSHNRIQFVSGSKDGTAFVWHFKQQQWKHIELSMHTKLPNQPANQEDDSKKLRVTMVCWDMSDMWIVTAVSDYKLRVWFAETGNLHKMLVGHTEEVFVLESHPKDPHVLLSAGHDGQIFVWNILTGKSINHFTNNLENQGHGAVFDAKWSPCGNTIAASDSHGHILLFGLGSGNAMLKFLPKELFFHTDYRPLVRDPNNIVLDEQTQIAPHLMPPPFLVDIDGNPYPPVLQRLVPGRENCDSEQLVPNIVVGNEGTQEVIEGLPEEHQYYDQPQGSSSRHGVYGRPGIRTGMRTSSDVEGIRQSSGNWERDPDIVWGSRVLVKPLESWMLDKRKVMAELKAQKELDEFALEMKHRPIMINTQPITTQSTRIRRRRKHYHTRSVEIEPQHSETEEDNNDGANSSETEFATSKEDSASSDSFSESSGYSDWVRDEGVGLEPPKRSKRKQKQRQPPPEESEPPEPKASSSSSKWEPQINHQSANKLKEVPELYKPLDWLAETMPKKAPYFPQMGDEVVYFKQGHQLYVKAVNAKHIYETNPKDFPWIKMKLKDQEFVKIVGIKYEIRPPRLCCLKLTLLDREGRLTGEDFTVKYHDMPDVLDFFVLKQTYEAAISRNWSIGDRFRCMIDDAWWIGEVISKSVNEESAESLFMGYEIRWLNGESENMSPWDMEPLREDNVFIDLGMPENPDEAVPVLPQELQSLQYQPQSEEWPNGDREESKQAIISGLDEVMGLAIAEPFLVPVDLSVYPSYAFIVEYPIDLSTIKARFENNFYRRITSSQFDVRYLATNAEKFNKPHSSIVKNARIITELCLRVIKGSLEAADVNTVYHQLVDSYESTDSEQEQEADVLEPEPSTSRSRTINVRKFTNPDDWKIEAKRLLDVLWHCEDSDPFRSPVDSLRHPEYYQIIDSPMDLGTVKEELLAGNYEAPIDFCKDMRLIFQNSKNYNTNKRSRIFAMTVRLSAMFEEHASRLIQTWKYSKRLKSRPKKKKIESEDTENSEEKSEEPDSSSSSSDDEKPLSKTKIMMKKPQTARCNGEVFNGTSDVSHNHVNGNHIKSSSSESASGDDSDYEPLSTYKNTHCYKEQPSQSQRKRFYKTSSSDSDDEVISKVRTRNNAKRRRYVEDDSDQEDEEESSSASSEETNSSSSGGVVTVSSRGRIRRMTARARALYRK
nr:bromodomain and WD repeat-containing protein 3 isoform X1 [Onthophagus taurus]